MSRGANGAGAYLTQEQLEKVRGTRICIIGAGGLGSNCAASLVRCGFTKLRIVDFDRVEPSNLNRQFYFADQVGRSKVDALRENLLRIAPDCQIDVVCDRAVQQRLPVLLDGCAVVVEAVDGAAEKKAITETALLLGKTVVGASGMGGVSGAGRVELRKIAQRFYAAGDFVSEVGKNCPPLAPKVAVVAAMQAAAVLEIVLTGDVAL